MPTAETPAPSRGTRAPPISARRFLLVTFIVVSALAVLEAAARFFVVGTTPLEARFPVDAVRGPVPYSMFGGVPNASLGAGYASRSASTVKATGDGKRRSPSPKGSCGW